MRRRALLLAVAVFAVEVVIATALRRYSFIRGSLGDFLVVFILYFGALAVRPWPRWPLAGSVFAFACAVEAAQGLGLASALGLRPGGLAHTLLGATFSREDVALYGLGCLACVGVDAGFVRRKTQ